MWKRIRNLFFREQEREIIPLRDTQQLFDEFTRDFKLSEAEIEEIENNEKFKKDLCNNLRCGGLVNTDSDKRRVWLEIYVPFFSRVHQSLPGPSLEAVKTGRCKLSTGLLNKFDSYICGNEWINRLNQ